MADVTLPVVEFVSLKGEGGVAVPFQKVWDLQKQIVEEVAEGRRSSTILFVEHPPTVTRGRGLQWTGVERERARPILMLPEGTEYFEIERGGDLTWHGPGQLVVYPILDLKNPAFPFARDIGKYVRFLERWISAVLAEYGLESHAVPNAAGVWIGSGIESRKIASLGVALRKWVSYHGLALNVNPVLSGFQGFDPCGFESSVMTSLERELGRAPSRAELERKFETQLHSLFARD